MPQLKPKPSEIAAEAKRTYVPYISQRFPQYPSRSFLHPDLEQLRLASSKGYPKQRLNIAVIDGDPVDVALDWYDYDGKIKAIFPSSQHLQGDMRIPIVNMANERRPGGDWESGLMAPEENLCRRSNLVQCLTTPWGTIAQPSNYPIPTKGGIYSPYVVFYRSGPDQGYSLWQEPKSLPVISVPPVRRPKLDETGRDYSFDQEKELMKDKIRTVLRIAAAWHHRELCIGAFGAGPGFRNPVDQLARMWKDVLYRETEFQGAFTNIVFAIEKSAGSSSGTQLTDHEVFQQVFEPGICSRRLTGSGGGEYGYGYPRSATLSYVTSV